MVLAKNPSSSRPSFSHYDKKSGGLETYVFKPPLFSSTGSFRLLNV